MFVEVAAVLHGVVEVQLVEAVEFLLLAVFVEVERKRRAVIHRTEAARRALEVDADLAVDEVIAFADGAADEGTVVLVELREFGRRNLDAQLGDFALAEEDLVGVVRLGRAWREGGQQRQISDEQPECQAMGRGVTFGKHCGFDCATS